MHCIGDQAIDQAITIFQKLRSTYVNQITTWRFEHFEMPSAEAIGVLADHSGIASMQPNFSWDVLNYRDRLGAETETINPLRLVANRGVNLVLGSDDAPLGPIQGIRWATVKAPNDLQRLTMEEALRYYTETAPEIAGFSGQRGRIALRYQANFAVFNRNPLDEKNWEEDGNMRLEEVWIKGEKCFE